MIGERRRSVPYEVSALRVPYEPLHELHHTCEVGRATFPSNLSLKYALSQRKKSQNVVCCKIIEP